MTGPTSAPWEAEESSGGIWNFRIFRWKENEKVILAEIPFVSEVPKGERAANQRLMKAAPALRDSAEEARAAIDATLAGQEEAPRLLASARAHLVAALEMALTAPPSRPKKRHTHHGHRPRKRGDGNAWQ